MRWRVTYLKTEAQTYFVKAKTKEEANRKASEREAEEEPDEEETVEVKTEYERLD